jgi:hypothetical protein
MPTATRALQIGFLALSCATAGAQPPGDAPARPLPGGHAAIESCVSSQALQFHRDDARAVLDGDDHRQVQAQMQARYPVLGRDGFEPSHIVLWQREGREWLYVTLLENPSRPGELCFTATFTASALAITPTLLSKYFALRSAGRLPATRAGG